MDKKMDQKSGSERDAVRSQVTDLLDATGWYDRDIQSPGGS